MDRLPNEIIQLVGRYLNVKTLRSFILVSKRHSWLLNDELYASASLRDDDEDGYPVYLLAAAYRHNVKAFVRLLSKTVDIKAPIFNLDRHLTHIPDELQRAPHFPRVMPGKTYTLHILCYIGLEELVRIALKAGADPHAYDTFGWTPIHVATSCVGENGTLGLVQTFIDAGVDLNVPARNQATGAKTPLHIAVGKKSPELVQLLMKGGASLGSTYGRIPDPTREGVLVLAARKGNRKVVECVLNMGDFSIDTLTDIFPQAVANEDISAAQALLDAGARLSLGIFGTKNRRALDNAHVDLNYRNPLNETLLHVSVQAALENYQSIDGFARLLGCILLGYHGVTAEDVRGRPGLKYILAERLGSLSKVLFFLRLGVDPSIPNTRGLTALDLVKLAEPHAPWESVSEQLAALNWDSNGSRQQTHLNWGCVSEDCSV